MKKIIKKVGKILAIAVGIIAVMLIVFILFLRSIGTPSIPEDAVLVTDSKYQHFGNVDLIREITMAQDFPPFDSKIYEYTNSKGEKEIYLSCIFNPEVPEDSVWALRRKMKNGILHEDSNGGMDFIKGWSKKEYMSIPTGVEEEMVLTICMFCGDNDFTMSFKKNPCAGGVSKDSLNNYLGANLPEFTIVNFISPDQTTLQFKEPISKETYKALEKNEWCEHKFEDDGTSICWIWKTEPGEYSTHITLDDQQHTAYISKSANDR